MSAILSIALCFLWLTPVCLIIFFDATKEERRQKRRSETATDRAARSTATATWVIAALTVATIGVGWSQYQIFDRQLIAMNGQLEEMKSSGHQADNLIEANKKMATAADVSNRAWISPRVTEVISDFRDGKPIRVQTSYDNAGKTPALNVEFHYLLKKVFSNNGRPVSQESYQNIHLGKNEACQSDLVSTAGVIYPASVQSAYRNQFETTDLDLVEKLRAKTVILVMQGCYMYVTLNEAHKSAFCVYLNPEAEKPIEQWLFAACGDGQEAD